MNEKKTYRLTTQLQVRAFLAKFGVRSDGRTGTYRAKGGVRLVVSGTDDNYVVEVIPLGCAC